MEKNYVAKLDIEEIELPTVEALDPPIRMPHNAKWDSIVSDVEFQTYLNSLGKSIADFQDNVEESRAIHELEAYNTAKPTSDSGVTTPPEGWILTKLEGGESKWLRLTAQDRAVVTSLAQLANEDLSIHLYNAHVLKSKANTSKPLRGDGAQVRRVWPPTSWTRWPMRPEDVPRGQFKQLSERDRDEEIWSSMKFSRGSVEDLEETIVAVIIKQAKERFIHRNMGSQGSRPSPFVREEAGAPGNGSASSSISSSSPEIASTSHTSSTSQSGKEETVDDIIRSAKRRRRASGFSHTSISSLSPRQQPTLMADDEKAAALLAPIARHMLSNLDKLLAGLHHQRQAYMTTTAIHSDTTAEDADSNESSSEDSNSTPRSPFKRPRGQSSNTAQSPSKRPKLMRRHSASQRPNCTTSQSSIRSSTSTDSQRRRTSKLGPRDWSDVIGIATLTGGFDQKVIKRAADRCASLFGEGVSFRTIGIDKTRGGHMEFDILPHGRRENALQKEPRKKVKKVPTKQNTKSGGLFCHMKWCKRHTQGFSRSWNLNKHMKEIHGVPTPKEVEFAVRKKQRERLGKGNEEALLDWYEAGNSEDEVEGGVHTDGYMQEVRRRTGWHRYWRESQGGKKYEKKRRKAQSHDGGRIEDEKGAEESMEENKRANGQVDYAVEVEERSASLTEGGSNETEEDQASSSDSSN